MKFSILNSKFSLLTHNLSRGFIASTRAFNLLTRTFNLPTRAFHHATCAFSLLTRGFELVTPNSCLTFPQKVIIIKCFCKVYKRLEVFVFIIIVKFMYRIKCKKLDIYFIFDCSVWFIRNIDLCYFY